MGRHLLQGTWKNSFGICTELLGSRHMLTLAPRPGSMRSGCCLLLKDAVCSHAQLPEDRGEGGRCYRTEVCSKGETGGRKINTTSRVSTPVRGASGQRGVRVHACARVCSRVQMPVGAAVFAFSK